VSMSGADLRRECQTTLNAVTNPPARSRTGSFQEYPEREERSAPNMSAIKLTPVRIKPPQSNGLTNSSRKFWIKLSTRVMPPIPTGTFRKNIQRQEK